MNAEQYLNANAEILEEDYIDRVMGEAITEDLAEEWSYTEIRPGYDRDSEIRRLRRMASVVDATTILYLGSWPDSTGSMRHRYEIGRPDGSIENVSYWLAGTAQDEAEEHDWIWID